MYGGVRRVYFSLCGINLPRTRGRRTYEFALSLSLFPCRLPPTYFLRFFLYLLTVASAASAAAKASAREDTVSASCWPTHERGPAPKER